MDLEAAYASLLELSSVEIYFSEQKLRRFNKPGGVEGGGRTLFLKDLQKKNFELKLSIFWGDFLQLIYGIGSSKP